MSLAGVAVLIVGLGWACRRMLASRQPPAESGVTLVARSLLTPRHQVLVLRVGRRVLVVGDSGHGMNLLCQITDPQESAALLGEPEDQGEAGTIAFEEPPEDETWDFAAAGDVRSVIERLRGLAGQTGRRESSETVP
jgi:flagellar biogenesis protein FliO